MPFLPQQLQAHAPFLQLAGDLAPVGFGKARSVQRCRLREELPFQNGVVYIRDIRPAPTGILGAFAIIPDRTTANAEADRDLTVRQTRSLQPQNILDLTHRQPFRLALLQPQRLQNRHDQIASQSPYHGVAKSPWNGWPKRREGLHCRGREALSIPWVVRDYCRAIRIRSA